MDWSNVVGEIEDVLAPKLQLDVYERALYYHLLRHTRLIDKEASVFGIAPLAVATGMSDWKVREAVRSMDAKGCIKIEDRSPKGHIIRVLLPSELPGLQSRSGDGQLVSQHRCGLPRMQLHKTGAQRR